MVERITETPQENFSRGLYSVELSEFGERTGTGKVREICVTQDGLWIMVTTDRQSAFDRMICTVPGKGQALNLLSAFWFEQTQDIVSNHLIAVPHPNVLIAKQATVTLPVEVVVRRYMACSSTSTSIYYNYNHPEHPRREIYGIKFEDGLVANQEFPMGSIVTPTTKAEAGHDQELTDEEAKEIVDGIAGKGVWAETRIVALKLFKRALDYHKERGLILADTKFEFGLDRYGMLMLIDEALTPDSSRFWLASSYEERLAAGANPESFDKDVLRRWLVEQGFRGEGMVPVVDPEVINQMATAYRVPYAMITGNELPDQDADLQEIQESIRHYLSNR